MLPLYIVLKLGLMDFLNHRTETFQAGKDVNISVHKAGYRVGKFSEHVRQVGSEGSINKIDGLIYQGETS